MADSEIKGRLLIASPILGDPNFHRTVVFMIEHSAEGALGVVLNRPTEHPVAEAVPGWEGLAAAPGVVFAGGPLEGGRVLGLGRRRGRANDGAQDGWTPVLGQIGMVDLSQEPVDAGRDVGLLRFFSGYAGWGAGQLEGELKDGAWFVFEATEADPITPQPDALWRQVFRRQPDDLKWVAFFPDDPTQN